MKKSGTAVIEEFTASYSAFHKRKATILLVLQFVLVLLLVLTIVLVCFVNKGRRLLFYLVLLSSLAIPLAIAIACNRRGKYKLAAWITSVCMIAGPWLSILLDPSVLNGDMVPIIYVGLSIQLCAILLTERETLIISVLQLSGVLVALLLSPYLQGQNWPSLFAFIVFTAAIGVSSGYTNRKQLEQIDLQHEQLLEKEEQLQELSIRDSLTKLYNRRYMEESFDREIEHVQRTGLPLAVIMADVDNFKTVNDTYGHVAGDSVLVYIAEYFVKNSRGSDIVCRYGGDEFLIILPECSYEEAFMKAEAARTFFSEPRICLESVPLCLITLSLGVAAIPKNGTNRKELVSAADKALYAAKQAGRNRVG